MRSPLHIQSQLNKQTHMGAISSKADLELVDCLHKHILLIAHD